MLMKPPSIFDDVVSQDSENYTVRSNRPKPSQAKKETTLRMGAPAQPRDNHSHEREGHSVHSNASSGSKKRDKRAKETTLGRPKVHEPRQEDTHSVHSNGSRHSQKSAKKESNIMQRPKIEQHSLSRHEQPLPNKPLPANNQELSFKNAIGDPEESVIKRYDLMEDSPQPVRYQQPRVKEGQRGKGKKFAPFMELEQRQASQEDIPIFRIEEPSPKIHNRVVGVAKQEGRPQRHDKQQRKQRQQVKQVKLERPQIKMDRPEALPIEQSQTVFDTSRLGNTKSVRRPIFAREQLPNTSKVSNAIDQSNVSGLQGSSRRKSNSRLRQLFNNSRQKQIQNESKVQSSLGELASQSRALGGKPAVGGQMARFERKVVEDQQFGIDSVKSNVEMAGLDLTISNHAPLDRDSLIFEFEPEKKKGMTVTSKNKQPARPEQRLAGSEQELLAIGRELTSAQQPFTKEQGIKGQGMKETAEGLPVLRKEMESKELAHVDRLLKENEEFLKSSAILNLSASDKLKRDSGDDYLFNLDDEPLPLPWQPKKEEPLDIKKVERNEKVAGRVQKNEIAKQTLPAEEVKRQQESKRQEERKAQPIKQQQPKQQQPIPIATKQQQPIFDQRPIIKQEQTKPREIQKQYSREQPTKSPGKIARNCDDGDSRSEKSGRSGKKGKTVKESALPRTKTHKVDIRNEAPRAEESFYEQAKEEKEPSIDDLSLFSRDNPTNKKTQQKQAWQYKEQKPVESKKPNVYRFSDDQNEIVQKPKSRTDVNFYDHEARSNKPPSSRPPLSGKSNKSKSTSKDKVPKQTTLKISSNQPQQQAKPAGNAFKKGGKMTLMERAMLKHGESEEDSQGSFSSREDFSHDSRRSSQSRGSRKSIKENTISIGRKHTPIMHARPPQRKPSSNSSSQEGEREPYSGGRVRQGGRVHEENRVRPTGSQRAIVSRNCTFIDEKGRLVQQDLVIRGGEVFGMSRTEDSTVQALDRMRRTKESRRSRSRSRDSRQRVEGKGSSFEKGSSGQDSSYCSSFYENSSWRQEAGGGALREFMKPVEQVPLYAQQGRQEAPRTFNDMFGKKQQESHNPSYSNISESRSRRSLKRTENSARKR